MIHLNDDTPKRGMLHPNSRGASQCKDAILPKISIAKIRRCCNSLFFTIRNPLHIDRSIETGPSLLFKRLSDLYAGSEYATPTPTPPQPSTPTPPTQCVYKIWALYTIFGAMKAEKCLWPIFGCKVGQSVPIVMKLKLNLWLHLLNVYTKFQIKPGKLRKIQKTQIPKIGFLKEKPGTYVEKYTLGHPYTNFEGFMRPWLQKMSLTCFWL